MDRFLTEYFYDLVKICGASSEGCYLRYVLEQILSVVALFELVEIGYVKFFQSRQD